VLTVDGFAQEKAEVRNPDKFKQMYDLLATPNMYRTASGAPGPNIISNKPIIRLILNWMIKTKSFMALKQ